MAGANDKGHRAKHAVTGLTKDQMKVSLDAMQKNVDADNVRREMIREVSNKGPLARRPCLSLNREK